MSKVEILKEFVNTLKEHHGSVQADLQNLAYLSKERYFVMRVKWQGKVIEIAPDEKNRTITLYENSKFGRMGVPLILSGADVTAECDTLVDKNGVMAKGHFHGDVYNIGEPFFLTVDFLADLKSKTVTFRHYMTPEESDAENE